MLVEWKHSYVFICLIVIHWKHTSVSTCLSNSCLGMMKIYLFQHTSPPERRLFQGHTVRVTGGARGRHSYSFAAVSIAVLSNEFIIASLLSAGLAAAGLAAGAAAPALAADLAATAFGFFC